MENLFDTDKRDEFVTKRIVLEIKYSINGMVASPNLICSLCGENLEASFTQKKVHYILCESCRLILNKNLNDNESVMKRSLGIGMFEKSQI